jgi:eukaryotic-like serine/threonine-protein kinase
VTGDSPVACVHCGSSASAAEAVCPECRGLRLVAGRYRIGRRLGEGGTAVVHEGLDERTQHRVAIKIMSLDRAREWKALDLFERGARIVAELEHPAIPKHFAFERDAAGRLYQARELMDGDSLAGRIAAGTRFDRRQVHTVLKALLEVLDYLHKRIPPVIHRDLKPANVMFRSSAGLRPVLVDFDTAGAGEPRGTGTTIVVSPGYTAPEQLTGDAQPASDLYSLGMTMVFMLTHEHPSDLPRQGGRLDITGVLASLEPATRHVISRLIEPDLSLRYASAMQALEDLRGLSPLRKAGEPAARSSWWARPLEIGGVSLFRIALGVLVGLGIGYGLLAWYRQGSGDDVVENRGMDAPQR